MGTQVEVRLEDALHTIKDLEYRLLKLERLMYNGVPIRDYEVSRKGNHECQRNSISLTTACMRLMLGPVRQLATGLTRLAHRYGQLRRLRCWVLMLLLCSLLALLPLLDYTAVTSRSGTVVKSNVVYRRLQSYVTKLVADVTVPPPLLKAPTRPISMWHLPLQTTPIPKAKSATSRLAMRPPVQSNNELLELIRYGFVRCSDIQAMFPDSIPPVVHWTNKGDSVLHQHQDLLRSWTRVLGRSVAYMYWSDKDAEQLIQRHYQQVWQQYQRLKVGIMRSDIARLVILHHIGGVYTDLDVQLLRSLHPLMLRYNALWSQEPFEHIYFLYKRTRFLSNAIFLTRARHPFLEFVLKSWPSWFEKQWSEQHLHLKDSDKAIEITGPLMLNHFLDIYSNTTNEKVHLASPDDFQAIWDGVYVQRLAKKECTDHRNIMLPEVAGRCDVLKAREYAMGQPSKQSYAVHKFLHTSYGHRPLNYDKSKPAKEILQLGHCVA